MGFPIPWVHLRACGLAFHLDHLDHQVTRITGKGLVAMYAVLLFVTQLFSRRKSLAEVLEPYHVGTLGPDTLAALEERQRGNVTIFPTVHGWLDHHWVEWQLLPCGCKSYRCDTGRCQATTTHHSEVYGCDLARTSETSKAV